MKIKCININNDYYSKFSNSNLPSKLEKNYFDTVNFNGHLGTEPCSKHGIKVLINETRFFRDLKTKFFIKDYILKKFANNSKILMLIGACSTGEEVYTNSMLIDELKNKLEIIGFDLGENCIKKANSKHFLFEYPLVEINSTGIVAFNDSFLLKNNNKTLNPNKQMLKKIFYENFELEKKTLSEKIKDKLKKIRLDFNKKAFNNEFLETIEQKVKLKENKCTNCTFKPGDILELDKLVLDTKVEVITFTNAMYHLLTTKIDNKRIERKNMQEIINNIVKNVKSHLKTEGLFVLGEDEHNQMPEKCIKALENTLCKAGFIPIHQASKHYSNVWMLGV